jgi:glycosyltransferase involved in cell wall biosynthesis
MKSKPHVKKLKELDLLDITKKISGLSNTVGKVLVEDTIRELGITLPSEIVGCMVSTARANNPKIAVVIPSYNTSDYIDQCLESLKNQTLNELEIIVIDDASSDDTLTKILSHANQDSRISVIALAKQSGSPGRARNMGLALASAPYIAFIDSDDWVDPNMLESLYTAAEENNSDITFLSGFINHLEGETTTRYYKQSHVNSEGKLKGFHESFMLWDKLWRRGFLADHSLQVGHTSASEELLFILKAYYLASSSSVAKGNYGYNYRRLNPTSITRNVRNTVYPSYEFEAWSHVDKWLSELSPEDSYRNIVSLRKALSFHYAISIAGYDHKQRFCTEAAQYLSDVFGDTVRELAMLLGYNDQLVELNKYLTSFEFTSASQHKSGNIIFGPDWSGSNPYQKLMYQSIRRVYNVDATGFSPRQLTKDYLYTKRSKAQILHLHWLHAFYDPNSHTSAVDFIEKIKFAKQIGYTVVWTAHNLMPHETTVENIENHIYVRTRIIEMASHIHVHDQRTAAALRAKFDFPKTKLSIAPHGLYEKTLSYSEPLRQHIRSTLGIEPGRFTVLLAGRIRGYKGIERAIEIFTKGRLKLLQNTTLIIAGHPDDSEIDSKITNAASVNANIKYVRGEISDTDLEALFLASDVCLLPYERSATSGLAFLSISYLTPLITSKLAAFEDFVERGLAISAPNNEAMEQALFYTFMAHAQGQLGDLFYNISEESIADLAWDNVVKLPSMRKIFSNVSALVEK